MGGSTGDQASSHRAGGVPVTACQATRRRASPPSAGLGLHQGDWEPHCPWGVGGSQGHSLHLLPQPHVTQGPGRSEVRPCPWPLAPSTLLPPERLGSSPQFRLPSTPSVHSQSSVSCTQLRAARAEGGPCRGQRPEACLGSGFRCWTAAPAPPPSSPSRPGLSPRHSVCFSRAPDFNPGLRFLRGRH